jgi:O-glycosyl hydrolase
MKDPAFAEAKAALGAIAAEADELKRTVGGSITDVVAAWLGPQYALAAREQFVKLQGADRFKLLRAFVQDWALLRHGDQTAERLQLEREWLAVASRDADLKWKRKIIVGLER